MIEAHGPASGEVDLSDDEQDGFTVEQIISMFTDRTFVLGLRELHIRQSKRIPDQELRSGRRPEPFTEFIKGHNASREISRVLPRVRQALLVGGNEDPRRSN